MAMYGPQRKLGYTEIVYNQKTGKFYARLPGDNYYDLNITMGGGGGATGFTSADVDLVTQTRTTASLPDTSGLKTQSDFNVWAVSALEELAKVEIPEEQDLSAYALKTEIPTDNVDLANGAGYITLSEVPEFPDVYTKAESDAKYLAVNISSLSELPTV